MCPVRRADREKTKERDVSKNTEQLTALALAALSQGEDVRGAVRVNYNGTVAPNTVSVGQSFAGLDLDDAQKPSAPDPYMAVSFPSAKQMGLVLTPGRIMVWALGMSGKPKQYLGEVPLGAIREAKTGETRFGPVVRFVMKSGAVIDLEIMKGEPADEFIEKVKELTATGGPDDG